MIILVQVLIRYALFIPFEIDIALNDLGFALLVITTVCLAAGGNIINDILDLETDKINKPEKVIINRHISEGLAYKLFFGLNITGVIIGFFLSHSVGKSAFFSIFVLISLALYIYSSFLKQTPLLGNIFVSVLVAASILIVGVFDLIPVMTEYNRETQLTILQILFDYAIFAFLINLMREMIKDIEDIDGDYNAGMNTLPIALGRDRAKHIAFAFSFIPIASVLYYLLVYVYAQQLVIGYFLVFIIAPLIYTAIKIYMAETKSHYKHISLMYKLIMLFGMLSLLLYPFTLK